MYDLLYGNEPFKTRLSEWLRKDCLPQAVLIEGEEGLGKHTAARYLAAAAECTGETPLCGQCRGCRTALADGHPDVRYYAPEKGKTVFSVDLAREIRNEAYLKPMVGRTSVAVLEHCERMNAEAQNALLKVLEEPPVDAMFLLLTENAGAMLTTVLSRCTTVRMVPVSPDDVITCLTERTGCDPEDAFSAAALADGNIGRALTLLGDPETAERKELADRWYRAFGSHDTVMLYKTACATEKADARDDILKVFSERLFADLHAAAEAGRREHTGRLAKAAEAVTDCRTALAANGNKALCLTSLCLTLSNI